MNKLEFIKRAFSHNLGIFIGLCAFEFMKIYWGAEKLFMVHIKGIDPLTYHVSKMSIEPNKDFYIFVTAEYLLNNGSVSEEKHIRKQMFSPFFMSDYSLQKSYFEHIDKVKSLNSPKDVLYMLHDKEYIKKHQLIYQIGIDHFNNILTLDFKDFWREVICKQELATNDVLNTQ